MDSLNLLKIAILAITGATLLYIIVRMLSTAIFKSYWEEKENAVIKFIQKHKEEKKHE
jgi:zinc transporter ZupT